MTRAIVFDSESPDIIELRKEFKEKFGSTEVFDYICINLRNRLVKDTMKAMIEWQENGELIHEKVKASAEVLSYDKKRMRLRAIVKELDDIENALDLQFREMAGKEKE